MSVSARPPTPPLDFIIRREDWCRYDLSDNAILKVKLGLTRVIKQGTQFTTDFQHAIVVLTNERGAPNNTTYTNDQILAAVTNDVRYSTVTQDWNEYVADDGTRIRIQPMIMRVAKTSLFDARGIPHYWVDMQGNVNITPPPSP